MSGVIETERLLLRPACSGDVGALVRAAEAATASRISELVVHSGRWWTEHGYGLWVLVPHGEDAVIGWCGLRPGADPRQPELLYGLQPMSRHKGLATEAARAIVAFALAIPGVNSVWAAAATMNLPSAAVMKRAGLVFESTGPLDGVDSVIYRISGGRTGI